MPQLRPAGCRSKRANSSGTEPIVIYLLDTNSISLLMREDARMATWLSSVSADDRVVICTIARGEALFVTAGALSPSPRASLFLPVSHGFRRGLWFYSPPPEARRLNPLFSFRYEARNKGWIAFRSEKQASGKLRKN